MKAQIQTLLVLLSVTALTAPVNAQLLPPQTPLKQLLEAGFKIVAAADSGNQPTVYVQKGNEAFACQTGAYDAGAYTCEPMR